MIVISEWILNIWILGCGMLQIVLSILLLPVAIDLAKNWIVKDD